jgi:hypothetical protein
MISKRTQIRVLVDGTPNGNGWVAKKIPIEGEENQKANRISLQIESPSNAIIGKYIVSLDDPKIVSINFFLFIVITRNTSN